jgi:hypothetical protein
MNGLLAVVLLIPASDAQFTIRPGEYEYEMTMDLGKPGGAEMGKAIVDAANKRRDCITPEDVKEKDFTKLMAAEMADANCKMSDNKTVGNKLTFTTTCVEDGMRIVSTSEMTFGADSFSGFTKAKDDRGRVMTMKVSAKRIGDCKTQVK